MTFAFSAKKVKVRALAQDILVINMDMGEQSLVAASLLAVMTVKHTVLSLVGQKSTKLVMHVNLMSR